MGRNTLLKKLLSAMSHEMVQWFLSLLCIVLSRLKCRQCPALRDMHYTVFLDTFRSQTLIVQ